MPYVTTNCHYIFLVSLQFDMDMTKRYLSFLLMIFTFVLGYSQEKQEVDYAAANKSIKVYKKLLKQKYDNEVALELAELYYSIGDYQSSDEYYNQSIDSTGVQPFHYQHYTTVLTNLGNDEKAETYSQKFKKLNLDARLGGGEISKVKVLDVDTSGLFINNAVYNSSDADFSPSWNDSVLYFVSTRKHKKDLNIDQTSGQSFYDVYKVDLKHHHRHQKAERAFLSLATDEYEGPFTFSNDGDVYFNKNFLKLGKKSKSKHLSDKIHLVKGKIIDGDIKDIVALDFNNESYSCTQPTLSHDGNYMIFASDMPGGLGGYDLYITVKDGDGWTEPKNLGDQVNSIGDEMYPYIHHNGNLYYSSLGLDGFGGMDIFISEKKGDNWLAPKNAGMPINSIYDEFGMIWNDEENGGYFSSNRHGGKGSDDVYRFKMLKDHAPDSSYQYRQLAGMYSKDVFKVDKNVLLRGIVKGESEEGVGNILVALVDENNDIIRTVMTDSAGLFEFNYLNAENYAIVLLSNEKQKLKTTVTLDASDPVMMLSADVIDNKNVTTFRSNSLSKNYGNILIGKIVNTSSGTLSGVDVVIADSLGNVVDNMKSNEDGYYSHLIRKNQTLKVIYKSKDESLQAKSFISYLYKNRYVNGLKYMDAHKEEEVDFSILGNAKSTRTGLAVIAEEVYLVNKSGTKVYKTETSANGYFSFNRIEPDGYYIIFENNRTEYMVRAHGAVQSKNKNLLVNGEESFDYSELAKDNLSGEKQLVVSGQVKVDGLQRPLEEITVYLIDESGNVVGERKLSKDGLFKFNKLRPMNYTVALDESNPNVKISMQAGVISPDLILSEEELTKFRYKQLKKDGSLDKSIVTIEGDVSTKDGKPVSDLLLFLINDEGKVVKEITTDDNGAFTFSDIPIDNYEIIPQKYIPGLVFNIKGIKTIKVKRFRGDLLGDNGEVFDYRKLGKDELGNQRMLIVRGQVDVGANKKLLNNLLAYLIDDQGNIVDSAKVNKDGSFKFDKLKPMNYAVSFNNNDPAIKATIQVSVYTPELVVTAKELQKFRYKQLKKDQSLDKSIVTIAGNVTYADGKPASDLGLMLFDQNGKKVKRVVSNENGNFSFANVPIDNYEVVPEKHIPGLIFTFNGIKAIKVRRFSGELMTADGDKFDFEKLKKDDLDDAKKLVVKGKVDLGGIEKDYKDVLVYLINEDGDIVDSTKVNSKGYFKFNRLDPMNYTVALKENSPNSKADVQIGIVSPDLLISKEQLEEYKYDLLQNDSEIDKSKLDLSGRLAYIENGKPVADQYLLLVDDQGQVIKRVKSDHEGRFSFDDINIDNYQIIPEKYEHGMTFNFDGIHIATPQKFKFKGKFIGEVFFEKNTFKLTPKGKRAMDNFAFYCKRNPEAKIYLNGFSSSEGEELHNKILSERRAKACLEYLLTHGVTEAQIDMIGHGEKFEFKDRKDKYVHAINRKVEMRIGN